MAYYSQLLALFLVLLCFFIMMVTGLRQYHARPTGSSVSEGSMAPDAGPAPLATGAVALLADLRARLAPQVGASLETGLGNGPAMTVVLPAQRLFERSSARPVPSGTALIDALAQSLAIEADARTFELEAVFSAPAQASQPLVTARAGTLARELVRHGAPAARVAVGIEEGPAERVRLSIYLRDLAGDAVAGDRP